MRIYSRNVLPETHTHTISEDPARRDCWTAGMRSGVLQMRNLVRRRNYLEYIWIAVFNTLRPSRKTISRIFYLFIFFSFFRFSVICNRVQDVWVARLASCGWQACGEDTSSRCRKECGSCNRATRTDDKVSFAISKTAHTTRKEGDRERYDMTHIDQYNYHNPRNKVHTRKWSESCCCSDVSISFFFFFFFGFSLNFFALFLLQFCILLCVLEQPTPNGTAATIIILCARM